MTPAPDDVRAAELAVIEAARNLKEEVAKECDELPVKIVGVAMRLRDRLLALNAARSSASKPSVTIPAGVHPSNLTTVIEVAEARVREIAKDVTYPKIEGLTERAVRLEEKVLDITGSLHNAIDRVEARLAALEASAAKREHELTDLFARFDGAHTSGLRERIEALERAPKPEDWRSMERAPQGKVKNVLLATSEPTTAQTRVGCRDDHARPAEQLAQDRGSDLQAAGTQSGSSAPSPSQDDYDTIAAMLPSVLASGTQQCPLCGQMGQHQHSPAEIVIYRNGVKTGRAQWGPAPSPSQEAAPTAEDWKQYAIYQKTEWDGSRNVPCAMFSVSYVEKMLRDCERAARERAIRECVDLCAEPTEKKFPVEVRDTIQRRIRALLALEKEA